MNNRSFRRRVSAIACAAAMAGTLLPISTGTATVQAANADTSDYAKLLQYSLYLYDANMCGTDVADASRMTWRGACHTADGVDGGFHDAGDHVKFGLPAGFSAASLGWSYYEFSDAFDSTGQTAHLRAITDRFARFFKDSTTLSGGSVTNFVYQVGDGGADHGEWVTPERQTTSGRTVYDSKDGWASDIAAEYAAALALNYLNFGNAEDLTYAKALYAYSTAHNEVATAGCAGFYDSGSYQDDQAWAAGWLYLATKEEQYKTDCRNKQNDIGWCFSWDNVSAGATAVYAHITGNWSNLNNYLSSICNGSGYYFCSEWGSARYNAAMQFTALAAGKNSSADYGAWCAGQMRYLLGENPANTCFVVGLGDNAAKYPHHRAASGYSGWSDYNAKASYAHTLVGALVGGPVTAGGSYTDAVDDYKSNEVTLDYNAGLVGAAAGLYAKYKTGQTVAVSSIPGVKTNVTDPEPVVTDTPPQSTTATTSTTPIADGPSEDGTHSITVGKSYPADYSNNFPAFPWSQFGIASDETVTKVEVTLSGASNVKWVGAFGSDILEGPNYWYQSDDMERSFYATSGTIEWELPADITPNLNKDLRIGFWYVEPSTVTIDKITVYTKRPASSTSSTSTSTTTSTTKSTTTTSTTKATTTTSTTKPTTTTSTTKATTTTSTTKPTTTTSTTKATTSTTKATTTTEPTTTVPVTNDAGKGDAGGNGTLDIRDVILLQRWLLGDRVPLVDPAAADMNEDGRLDIFDLALLKRALLKK